MSMAPQTAPRTRAELLALPDDGCRHELIDGEHIVTPAPGVPHQAVLTELMLVLGPHVRAHALGQLYASPADLALGEEEVLQPDLFVALPTTTRPTRWEEITALRLVIEIVSPSTARTDRERKRLRYQRAGVPDYWIVDPELRQVEVWHPDSTVGSVAREQLVWTAPTHAPLVIDLSRLFTA